MTIANFDGIGDCFGPPPGIPPITYVPPPFVPPPGGPPGVFVPPPIFPPVGPPGDFVNVPPSSPPLPPTADIPPNIYWPFNGPDMGPGSIFGPHGGNPVVDVGNSQPPPTDHSSHSGGPTPGSISEPSSVALFIIGALMCVISKKRILVDHHKPY